MLKINVAILQQQEPIPMSAIYVFTALILFGATHAFAADDQGPDSRQRAASGIGTGPLLFNSSGEAAGVDPQVWTLEASIRRALSSAPEMRAAEAEIAARTGSLRQADEWPNPVVTLRADEKLGIEDGRGGYTLNQVTVTQALPMRRLEHQRRAAAAGLEAARANQNYQRLLLETRTAQAFHALQLAAERQLLAQERLAFAEKLHPRDERSGSDRIVRYLSPLERARLDILRATAQQEVALTEGKWSESLAHFRALLAMPPDALPETARLLPASVPESLGALLSRLEAHPALRATQQARDASLASVDVARAQRLADPTLSVIHEQDYLGGERRNYLGLMLGVQIPVWNRNNGGVARAYGEAGKAEAELEMQRRDLLTRLRQSHLHLGHLVEQAEHYLTHLLQPARQVLDLTRRGYIAGEQNGLALVDASNTYFDAQARYLELLRDAWNEAAELRLAAGVSLLDATTGDKP
jgi:cobalt-zinc-cadmium efflux system outer membrane protein